jgi:hypothetical protein
MEVLNMNLTAKSFVLAAALFGVGVAGAGQASAAPIAPSAGIADNSAPIIEAGWRCGPGWHVNPWGRCVPNGYGYGYARPYYGPRVYAPRVYRPYGYGYHGYYRRW